MLNGIFKYYKADISKLTGYGFVKEGAAYKYQTFIANGQLVMSVYVNDNGKVSANVADAKTQDEYVLHLVEGSAGEFVGKVRGDYKQVLTDIKEKCFYKDVFQSNQAKQIIDYVRETYGDELEFLWEKFDNNAVWRRKDNSKWYGVLLTVAKNKLGLDGGEQVEIIDLRIEPEKSKEVVDNQKYFAGYHMNKKSWLTICLDGSVPTETILSFIDRSYQLALKK